MAAAKKYAAIGTSPKSRTKTLGEQTFPGVYIQPRLGYIKPLYTLTPANLTGSDGVSSTKQFVAQGINDSTKLQPEAVSLDIAGNVIILSPAPTPSSSPPSIWKAAVGKPFTKADVTGVPSVHALIPDDNTSYVFIVIPKSLVIVFGVTECHRGTLDDISGDILDLNIPGCNLWSIWISQWSKPIHDAAAASFLANPADLDGKLPSIKKKFANFFADSALTTTETLYIDDVEHGPAIDALKKRLSELRGCRAK